MFLSSMPWQNWYRVPFDVMAAPRSSEYAHFDVFPRRRMQEVQSANTEMVGSYRFNLTRNGQRVGLTVVDGKLALEPFQDSSAFTWNARNGGLQNEASGLYLSSSGLSPNPERIEIYVRTSSYCGLKNAAGDVMNKNLRFVRNDAIADPILFRLG